MQQLHRFKFPLLVIFLGNSLGDLSYQALRLLYPETSVLLSVSAVVAAQPLCLTPTTPTQDPPMLLPFSSRRTQQPRQQVPGTWTPAVPMPLPSSGAGRHLKTRKQGTATLTYCPWNTIARHLHHRAPGWCWEVQSVQEVGGAVVVTGRLTIPTAEGDGQWCSKGSRSGSSCPAFWS